MIFIYFFYKIFNNFQNTFHLSRSNRETAYVGEIIKFYRLSFFKLILNGWDINSWRNDLEQTAQTIFSSFKFLVISADWLDNIDNKKILQKTDHMKFESGAPRNVAEECTRNFNIVYENTTSFVAN